MASAHTTRNADRYGAIRRGSGVLLLLSITSLLVACGGGGADPAAGGGGGGTVACVSGPAPAVLTWDAVVNPKLTGYLVYYGDARSGTFTVVEDVGNVTTHPVSTGLSSGTTYIFAVTAYDNSPTPIESDFSNVVCKTIS